MRAVCESFHLSKDAGFKVVAHMMPDLPNVGMERDIEQFIVSASKHYYSLWRMSRIHHFLLRYCSGLWAALSAKMALGSIFKGNLDLK